MRRGPRFLWSFYLFTSLHLPLTHSFHSGPVHGPNLPLGLFSLCVGEVCLCQWTEEEGKELNKTTAKQASASFSILPFHTYYLI